MEDFDIYLHAQISCIIHFLWYYILKNPAIWLAGNILAITQDPKFCQICWSNINNNISSRSRLFSRKTNIKFFKKSKKTPIFRPFLGPFCPNLGRYEFSWKKRHSQFFNIRIIYHCAKKTKQPNERSLKKLLGRHAKNLFISLISLWDTVNFREP